MLLKLALVGLAWLAIHPNGTREIWDVKPHLKVDGYATDAVPVGTQVIPWTPVEGHTDPNEYIRGVSDRCVLKPVPEPPQPSATEQASRDINAALRSVAGRDDVDDVTFIKLYRLQFMQDEQKRKDMWDTVKQGLPAEVKE